MAHNGEPQPRTGDTGYNVALCGAASLKGKELKEILQERHFPLNRITLFDAAESGGQLTEFDEEPAVILPVSRESFEDISLAFFADSSAFTRDYWQLAEESGCEIIDLSYFLESNPRARIQAPVMGNLRADAAPNESAPVSRIFVAAHPAAIAIAGIFAGLSRRFSIERSAVTVFEPVSEYGKAGVDELHRQTVNLLAFQKIPQQVFQSQVAFNLLASYGEDRKPTLKDVEARIRSHIRLLLGEQAVQPALRVLQVPVFYGYTFSCFVDLKESVTAEAVEAALEVGPLEVRRDPGVRPNVVEAAGSNQILLGSIEKDPVCESGYWIWGAFDNLRLATLNAVQIAEGLVLAQSAR